ncbi:MAG: hypothetical protein HFF70_02475 [Oscillospiraceae bacterium]|jgi:hypothetical protein|nr:hypothetical protein [Oscillospiraceae bacterium]
MEIDTWINGCKVRGFPWVDGQNIYFHVEYYKPGQSLSKPPVWERTVYIVDNAAGRRAVGEFTHSLVQYISMMPASRFDLSEGHRLLVEFD